MPPVRSFLPDGGPRTEATFLNLEELEAVRLVDLLDLEQEEAAFYMGISRKALWNDLTSARKKIAMALVYGMGIRIEGGSYVLRDVRPVEPDREAAWATRDAELYLLERELEQLSARVDRLKERMESLQGGEEAAPGEGPP